MPASLKPPEKLDAATGSVRQALITLKSFDCLSRSSPLEWAESASTRAPMRVQTSIACVPMEPVEPIIETLLLIATVPSPGMAAAYLITK